MIRRLIEHRWAFVPVLLLAGTVASAFTMVKLSMGDGSALAVEPDYYRKAAHWDDLKQQRALNGYLNWVISPDIVRAHGDATCARLELTIADKHGVRIDDARVTVELFPLRAASNRSTHDLDALSSGRYGIDIPVRENGQWEFRVSVLKGDKLYTDSFRRHLHFAGGAP